MCSRPGSTVCLKRPAKCLVVAAALYNIYTILGLTVQHTTNQQSSAFQSSTPMQQLNHSCSLQVEARAWPRQVQQLRALQPSPSRPLQQPWPRLQLVSRLLEPGTAICSSLAMLEAAWLAL